MFRRLVFVGAMVGMLVLAPVAAGTPPDITVTISGTLGANGWYRSNVTVNWQVEGETSSTGCDTVTLSVDTPGTRLTCSAESNGDSTSKSITIRLDKTPPSTSTALERQPDANGWYNHPLIVSFAGTDATAGIDSCDAAQSYSGPDSGAASVRGSCRDRAGNSMPNSFGLKYDATAPQVAAAPGRVANANGWYNAPLAVTFTGGDATSGLNSCDSPKSYAGPDNAAAAVSGSCRDTAGNVGSTSFALKYDATAPQASSSASRVADANGWYNHPLTVSFAGTDATAGIDSCGAAQSYSGPDRGAASVGSSCRDVAGNVTPTSFSFKYDSTAPTLSTVSTKLGNRSAQLAWRASTDTRMVEILRAPGRNGAGESVVYRGSGAGYRDTGLIVGRKYEYRVAGVDEAANRAEQKVAILATGALLSPVPAARVTAPPNLSWTPVKGASYYNVQLIRGRKVLSAWPMRPGFQLRRTWIYNGRRYRLRPGVYRWYVWPGLGRIKAARYGRLLGSSTFVVSG